MAKRSVFLLIFAASVAAMAGCGSTSVKNPSFRAQYKQIAENSITGAKDERTTSVWTDGRRFRLEDDLSVKVFDGTKYYSKAKDNPGGLLNSAQGKPAETYEEPMTDAESLSQMFWFPKFAGKKSVPGGLVSGQDTVLYEVKEIRPDGEMKVKIWTDARHNVILKSQMSIYSSQIEQMVMQQSFECASITFAPQDETLFAKPD